MKQLISLLVILWILGCQTVVILSDDEVRYAEIKDLYDTITKEVFNASQYENLSNEFTSFINDYPASSYMDNSLYYAGRLLQKWGNEVNGSDQVDMYNDALSLYRDIPENSGNYNEALFRIGETLEELYALDQVELVEVISAFDKVLSVAPNSNEAEMARDHLTDLESN